MTAKLAALRRPLRFLFAVVGVAATFAALHGAPAWAADPASLRVEVIPRPVSAGAAFTVKATAYNASGKVETSYNGSATWSDLSGTLAPATPNAFVNGVSQTSATVSTPFKNDQITFNTASLSKASAAFNVLGPPHHFKVGVSGSPQVGSPFTVTITAQDAVNNTLPGYVGTASWSDLSGTLSPASPASFVNGISTTSATVSVPYRADKITASDTGNPAITGQSPAFHVVGSIDHFLVNASPPNHAAGVAFNVTATAKDAAGNTVTSYSGSPNWSDLTGDLSPASPAAFSNGVSTTSTTISTPIKGDKITFTDGAATGVSGSFNIVGALDHFVVTPVAPFSSGSPFTVKVTAKDAVENTVASYAGSPTWADLSGNLTPSAPTSFVDGVSTTSATVSAPYHRDKITVTDGAASGVSPGFDVLGTLDHFDVAVATPVSAGSAFTVKATAKDSAGNTLPGYAGSATLSDLSGNLSPTGAASFVNGVSTTSATVSAAYQQDKVTVTDGAATGTSAPFNVFGPLDHFAVVVGSGGPFAEGQSFVVRAYARDAADNFLAGYADASPAWSDLGSPSTLAPASPSAFIAGVSQTTASVADEILADKITVTSGGKTGTSAAFDVDARPTVTGFSPADGDVDVARGANIVVTFSEPVTADATGFALECPSGTAKTFAVTGSGTPALTLDPAASLPAGETCTVAVLNGQVSDTDTVDPPDHPVGVYSASFTVAANATPTDISLSASSLPENQPSGTSVGTLSTTDADPGDTFTYSLVAGAGDTDNGSFQIDGSTLKTNASFDFETKNSYAIRIRTTDAAAASFEKQFTISVTDVNEAPTDIALSASSLDENQPSGTSIGTLSATDPDSAQTHTFSLPSSGCSGSFPDNSSFSITGGTLKSAAAFNYEVKSSYTICVRTTDNGTPNLSFDKQFTISVTDVNDAPTTASDSYTGAIGNTRAQVQTTVSGPVVTLTGNVLTNNDSDEDVTFPHTVSAVAETVSSTGGGTATIATDGSFVFTPGVGDKNQNDTFTYHATDGSAQSAGTVTVHIDDFLVWYVDRDAASNGDGRSSSPLQNLAGINGAGGTGDSDGSSDYIFLYSSATPYTGGLPLETSQKLWGETNGLTVNGKSLVSAGGTNPVVQNSGGAGIQLANGVDVQGINVSTASGAGISGSSVTTATVGTSVAGTISGATGGGVSLSGSAGGNISIANSIVATSGHSVSVANRSSGTVTFSGAINDTGTGISLSSNTGATVTFSGGVTASTGTNSAFSATSGGTVTVTGSANTLTTTTGTALTVTSTTIGSSDLNFKSISSNGATNGIVLSNTGSSGGLTVAGSGSSGSGGTIQNTTGDGVSLTTTEKVSLTDMTITNASGSGIHGSGVNGFTVDGCTITDNGDSAASDESGILVTGLTGTDGGTRTTSITNSTISNNWEFEVQITNSSGTLSNLQMSGNTISADGTQPNHGNLVNFLGGSTSTMKLSVTSGTFTGNTDTTGGKIITGTGISAVNQGTTHTVNVSGATFTDNNAGVDVSSDAISTTLTFTISGNDFQGSRAVAINSFHNGNAPYTRTIDGTITGNTIGTSGVADSGSAVGNGISVSNEGAVSVDYTITNNVITQVTNFPAISVNVGLGGQATAGGTTNLLISGNTFSNIGSRAVTIQDNQDQTLSPFPTICASVTGNTFGANITGQAGNGQYMRLRELSGNVRVVQATPTSAASASELDDANGFNDPTKINISGGVSFSQACL